MSQPEEDGYQEIGQTLAGPVVEGVKDLKWAVEIARLLGYGKADVSRWVEKYRLDNADEIQRRERVRQRKLRKLDRWQKRIDRLRTGQNG